MHRSRRSCNRREAPASDMRRCSGRNEPQLLAGRRRAGSSSVVDDLAEKDERAESGRDEVGVFADPAEARPRRKRALGQRSRIARDRRHRRAGGLVDRAGDLRQQRAHAPMIVGRPGVVRDAAAQRPGAAARRWHTERAMQTTLRAFASSSLRIRRAPRVRFVVAPRREIAAFECRPHRARATLRSARALVTRTAPAPPLQPPRGSRRVLDRVLITSRAARRSRAEKPRRSPRRRPHPTQRSPAPAFSSTCAMRGFGDRKNVRLRG